MIFIITDISQYIDATVLIGIVQCISMSEILTEPFFWFDKQVRAISTYIWNFKNIKDMRRGRLPLFHVWCSCPTSCKNEQYSVLIFDCSSHIFPGEVGSYGQWAVVCNTQPLKRSNNDHFLLTCKCMHGQKDMHIMRVLVEKEKMTKSDIKGEMVKREISFLTTNIRAYHNQLFDRIREEGKRNICSTITEEKDTWLSVIWMDTTKLNSVNTTYNMIQH